ncbi:ABC-type multidrug transport system, ATPase component [Marinitoga piezophila KA3]|uniref:ABC-type multidrug transport system, ATPase component n=1 Tax=Marinitoga piezophila (strain DSM 14283 / JCM 11233 / KA3) TaxID=443254 RepID=H2J7J3_MARPK|nr:MULTISPECIES: ABC transporter ATP-binding protein [Marinitoga]AEX86486.1 ABC-type multidrug transport system, ATPase component [Marinitoga piezophila KA3]APT76870.1 ABC transporter ATPase [Marinitoga sp. 1137]
MITIENLTKYYKNNLIFKNVNMLIPENKVTLFIGANGSGKTTLFKCLLNLEDYRGKILYDGKCLNEIRDTIYVIYDDTPLYYNLSGYKNIELLLNKKISIQQIKEISYMFLKDEILKLKVKYYSHGQRKKLSLIIAMLTSPKYLFMDEIANGLDYNTKLLLKNFIKKWSKKMTIIMTGHQFEFYDGIIDELFILKDHSIIKINEYGGDLSAIYKNLIK